MRLQALLFTSALFSASVASGQNPSGDLDRRFPFIHTEKAQSLQEIAVGIRVISDMKQVSMDTAQKSLMVSGTAVQIGIAEWLSKELDQALAPPSGPELAVHEYRLPDSVDNVVRVFYLPRTETVQDFQEVATLVRTIVEIRRVFTYNASRALVLRGTADQIAAAEWVVGQVAPTGEQGSNAREYRMVSAPVKGFDESLVRVFSLPNTPTIQDFQQVATMVRTIAQIRRVFTYNRPRAVAVRGTDEQIAMAEWLLRELDHPTGASRDYRLSGSADDVVRVFTLTHAESAQRVQEIATEVRTATSIPFVFTYNTGRVVAARGTAAQIAQADRMIKERDK